MIRTTQLLSALARCLLRVPFVLIPEGRVKFGLRSTAARTVTQLPAELLVNPGETMVVVGGADARSVTLWSDLVGEYGRVVLVDDSTSGLETLREVLEDHLSWPLRNIVYACRGENQTIDELLAENAVAYAHHVQLAGEGVLEWLASMKKLLAKPCVRLHVRSFHVKDGRIFYPQVIELLRNHGFSVTTCRDSSAYECKSIYAARLPAPRGARVPARSAESAR